MVASWLRNSGAEAYFRHFNGAQGTELQAAVSAELILLCENWFLNPRVWGSFSRAKRSAIIEAFNNLEDLRTGRYVWRDRADESSWHEYLNLGNRHQINLFRYNRAIFAN